MNKLRHGRVNLGGPSTPPLTSCDLEQVALLILTLSVRLLLTYINSLNPLNSPHLQDTFPSAMIYYFLDLKS